MPFADAKYPPEYGVDGEYVQNCIHNIRLQRRVGERMVLDALLGIENHDPKQVMRVCAEAFRCIDVWVERLVEKLPSLSEGRGEQCAPTEA